ncbi:unnamed protein product [Prorocentrum cordatum]|uniref:Prefoldin subunit 4 n=1 Tax=Prorocentrum cordatum TaxID=2364126 RepID=A0ABN9T371_9DINO|nr:unnamed protein product [Polarella glacialis]
MRSRPGSGGTARHFAPSFSPGDPRDEASIRRPAGWDMAVEERDIQVEKDDQVRINKFSRLHMRFDDIDEEIIALKKKVQTYKDATEEIEGCMELDGGILMRIGEAFTGVEEDTAVENLSKLTESAEARLSQLTDEIEQVKTDMDALKKVAPTISPPRP